MQYQPYFLLKKFSSGHARLMQARKNIKIRQGLCQLTTSTGIGVVHELRLQGICVSHRLCKRDIYKVGIRIFYQCYFCLIKSLSKNKIGHSVNYHTFQKIIAKGKGNITITAGIFIGMCLVVIYSLSAYFFLKFGDMLELGWGWIQL